MIITPEGALAFTTVQTYRQTSLLLIAGHVPGKAHQHPLALAGE
jgi:hypothetical protein